MSGPTDDTGRPVVLEIAGLTKHYGEKAVIDGVSFEIHRGDVVSVLGPSGAGKSTMLRAINWLEPPDRGKITFMGTRVSGLEEGRTPPTEDVDRLRRGMAMVFQNFALWPHLTVIENISIAPIRVQGRNRDEVREEASELLRRVGLLDKRDSYPSRLSGGQKQRVGIARALAMRPPLLLLDEPTSALDPELVGEVLTVIKDLAAQHMTMLVVTHEIAFAREISDRILFLDEGKLLADMTAAGFFEGSQSPRVRQFLTRYAGL